LSQRSLNLQNLREYNISQIGNYTYDFVFLGYYDKKNTLVAGLYGYLYLGMFYIDLLWVDKNLRQKKTGSALLMKAEEYAASKNALYIRINTASFQSVDFYLKQGYEILTKLPLLVNGKKDQFNYYLVKFLPSIEYNQ